MHALSEEYQELQEKIASEAVLEFFSTAQKYCHFIENVHGMSLESIRKFLIRALPLLYLRAQTLPEIDEEHTGMNEKFVTEEQWQDVFNDLREVFGEKDEYWKTEDNLINPDMVRASLSDNLADIYQDMKDFVIFYQKPFLEAKITSVWDIKRLFRKHWGFRVADALRILHYQEFGSEIEPDYTDLDY